MEIKGTYVKAVKIDGRIKEVEFLDSQCEFLITLEDGTSFLMPFREAVKKGIGKLAK